MEFSYGARSDSPPLQWRYSLHRGRAWSNPSQLEFLPLDAWLLQWGEHHREPRKFEVCELEIPVRRGQKSNWRLPCRTQLLWVSFRLCFFIFPPDNRLRRGSLPRATSFAWISSPTGVPAGIGDMIWKFDEIEEPFSIEICLRLNPIHPSQARSLYASLFHRLLNRPRSIPSWLSIYPAASRWRNLSARFIWMGLISFLCLTSKVFPSPNCGISRSGLFYPNVSHLSTMTTLCTFSRNHITLRDTIIVFLILKIHKLLSHYSNNPTWFLRYALRYVVADLIILYYQPQMDLFKKQVM